MARILLIEDNAANTSLTCFVLESAGHTVNSATTAEIGISLVHDHRPDLILMDIHLPGMDGLHATSLLKADASTREIPVVALTALTMSGDEARILAAGCDGYIAKPMRYLSLLAAVLTYIGRRVTAT
ncbi:response regulator [Gemmatimonas groenlandica]|uniref:Response regulator n=1 Tax=Gemmatimonas groenlandica TaxID=2732249 RepID=A0A6M4IMX1_9BACT|nr:response regulator [Gemmatimonas groenlandica]QJR35425.1 response regulator [Gemmatimonas groenlandica]